MAIVLFRRLRRLSDDQRALLAERSEGLHALEGLEGRVLELEDRLDFTERLLAAHPTPPGQDPAGRIPSDPSQR